jgi:DNA gyrase subunit A
MTDSNTPLPAQITQHSIEKELQTSYLDYAMSVIVGRALPDVRDGLKPVHRRVLFAMEVLKNHWNKPYKKSARVVGDVIGKYHPHGDTAVYDAIVRLAQPFSMRYLLVDGQGNFGSVDGDSPAAMRYTEIRMTKLAHSILADLDKETVDFVPNYDGTEMAPSVMPSRVPNLLINGSTGIAVGMATNIPPHNLNEVLDACIHLINNPECSIQDLINIIPGPDFPTAAIINGRSGIISAYMQGRGRVVVRAKTEIETNAKGKSQILIHELPYQVNKARLLEKIGELVRHKKIEGITALRDESDQQGMRVVIEIRKGDQPEVVLNNLFSLTQMQNVFGINMVALDKGQPKLFNLKEMLVAFLSHRREVITRRTIYELNKARDRAHLLEGLTVALENIDPIIAMIKAAKSPAAAKVQLLDRTWPQTSVTGYLEAAGNLQTRPKGLDKCYGMQDNSEYRLSPEQATAILELKLHRLTGLEQDKITKEYKELITKIAYYLQILTDSDLLHKIMQDEFAEIRDKFADPRRTVINEAEDDLTNEDLIPEEDVVVTLSNEGYVKNQSLDEYRSQRRGGRGKVATRVKEEDFVKNLLIANSHATILCFSSSGKVYWLKTYKIPQASRTSRGRPIINLLPLTKGEQITAILPLEKTTTHKFIFMATKRGKVKKVAITEFAKPRNSGKIALDLAEGDTLISAGLTSGDNDIMLIASSGKAIRFSESDVRVMGRTAAGVRGIKLKDGQRVIALIIPDDACLLLTATENGYGQRTRLTDYRAIGRGGQGVIAIQTNERNGSLVGATQVCHDDEMLLITDNGSMIRTRSNEVSIVGRNTQGVRLIKLSSEEKLVGLAQVESLPEEIAEPEADNVAE